MSDDPSTGDRPLSRRDFLMSAGAAAALAALGTGTSAAAAAKTNTISRAGHGVAADGVTPAMHAGAKIMPGSLTAKRFETARKQAEAMVKQLTVEEKLDQLTNRVPAVPRVGLPGYNYWTEALHGVHIRGPVTSFPIPAAMGNSWNLDLISRVYKAVSDEARAKHNQSGLHLAMYSPATVNMGARDPRWGRLDENFSEDPTLVGEMATATIRAMQGDDPNHLKTLACAKHFIGNDTESDRHRVSAEIDPRSFWEYYTRGFHAAVVQGHVATVMSSYNAVNGVPCSADHALLTDLLRDHWGFSSYVTSDCGAVSDITSTHHYTKTHEEGVALALRAGCDINCGREYRKYLGKALKASLINEQDVDRALTRALTGRAMTGELNPKTKTAWDGLSANVLESKAHRELAREAGRQTIVLLKNETRLLPLNEKTIKSYAVIGPLADRCYLGGYSGHPQHEVSPLDGLRARLGVAGAPDGSATKYVNKSNAPRVEGSHMAYIKNGSWLVYQKQDLTGKTGIHIDLASIAADSRVEVHLDRFDGKMIASGRIPNTHDWSSFQTLALPLKRTEGEHRLVFRFLGSAAYVANFRRFQLTPVAKPTGTDNSPQIIHAQGSQVTRGTQALLDEAVAAAKKADVALLFVGADNSVCHEQRDRADIALPDAQQNLIQAVSAANARTVVIITSQVPVAVNWAQQHVPAIVSALCAGQEQGNAIADVLLGDFNPGGKLAMTWYASVDDLPDFHDYDLTHGRTYMYFQGKPLYPFGFGLSYTSFAYAHFALSDRTLPSGGKATVSFDLKNTGQRDGDEIVQLYAHVTNSKVKRPNRQLIAYRRVHLKAGESQRVSLEVPHDHLAFRHWEEKTRQFVVDAGTADILVGASSEDIRLKGTLHVLA